MWISRKLASMSISEPAALTDRFNKPLPPLSSKIEPLVIVVTGQSNIGKSTFIRFGLQNLIAKHDSNRPDLQCYHTNITLDSINYPIDIIEVNESDMNISDLPFIHGGIACYDATDDGSVDCIPDLLNYYLTRQIPTFLVQLKSDLTESFQLNKDLYPVQQFKVDAFSETGVNEMKNVFKCLVEQYYPRCVNKQEEIKTRDSYVYAPTRTIVSVSATSGSEADPDKALNENNHIVSFPPSFHMTNKRGTFPSHLNSRRGSKDSSDSFGIGLTPEDIIDRLLSTDNNKTDENIIPIFLTFFRKFMKPFELVKTLVERFENDGLSDALPTDLQKRIHSVFTLWLSHYWNDFYGSHARKHIILFLDRISKYDSLTPICDSLAPLVVREPPSYDPDKVWGLIDDEYDDDDEDDQMISPPTTPIKRNEKKDSGYVSGTFSFVPSSPTKPEAPPFILKRLSNTSQPSTLLSPNLNRLLLRTNSKVVTHSESHPDLRSTYAAHKSPLSSANELPRRAEFAGGLINIDNAIKHNKLHGPSSMTPSLATTTGRWTSSLGHQLLASSFISSFRPKTDKDQTGSNYKTFMKAADASVADQLTWIESELFSKIKPREFIRNIWNTPVSDKRSSLLSCSNTVLASIAHFNFISAWVVTVIVTQSRLSKRVALLQKFMSIAVELRNLNNYNTLMAILAGINSASVLRLKQTRQGVATKKVYKQFQSLERLMSTDKSFSSYRMALKASSSGAPGIPYLGIHTQDLVSLAEANKDFRADGTIHWEKFRLMGETIMATMKFKCPSYTIEPDAKLLAFIADTYILSEDDQYKLSTTIEPRLATASTSRLRELWLRI